MERKTILLLGLILATILIAGCGQQTSNKPIDTQNKCSSDYTISCQVNAGQKLIEVTKESILCSSDSDCSITNISNFCSPGFPSILKCSGEMYYCGDDGLCKRCDDSCGKNEATQASGPPNS